MSGAGLWAERTLGGAFARLAPASRREMLGWLGATPALISLAGVADANDAPTIHRASALALMGDVKYPRGFRHFDYVNPNAPKGGEIRITAVATFDSLNPFIIQGTPARGALMIYESMMVQSMDEPATQYGLLAEGVEYPSDFSWATFHLCKNAYFHDGAPVTADDVIFSTRMLKKSGHPSFRQYYADVSGIRKLDAHTVRFEFGTRGNRERPLTLGQLGYVLPRHFWLGKDSNGAPRDFSRSTLEPPLGSGPYRVGRFEPGRFIEYLRVKDHWSRDLPVNVGQHNFDVVRYDFYRDVDVAVTAFLAGSSDVRLDMSPKSWATRYDVPAVRTGKIRRTIIPDDNPNGMEGYFFNLRRSKFQDRRVRQALTLAFDFEWVNKHMLYGLCTRLNSYFQNSDLAATGLPEGAELELLTPFRDQLPNEVFTRPFSCPVTRGDGDNRANLRTAMSLFEQAGYRVRDGQMIDAKTGAPFSVEFLDDQPGASRVLQPYFRSLAAIGVRGILRVVDTAQLQNRLGGFDFDIVSVWSGQSLSPGAEQRDLFGSAAADTPNSGNIPGVRSPVVDALIDRIVSAKTRPALAVAVRALDRVLLWEYLCVPQWTIGGFPCAYWDRFGVPAGRQHLDGLPSVWWQKRAREADSGPHASRLA
jgi:microcin C transport system substrate-binding protein